MTRISLRDRLIWFALAAALTLFAFTFGFISGTAHRSAIDYSAVER